MPVVRINSDDDGAYLHGSPQPAAATLTRLARGAGPVIVMVHGYKYQPGHHRHCPHRTLLAQASDLHRVHRRGWLDDMGFGADDPQEGLALAFGWSARGALWQARTRAEATGKVLAQVISQLHSVAPDRPVHIMAHSMGAELAFAALHHLAPGQVQRMITMAGAVYRSRAEAALASPGGSGVELLNVTSRENDPFDFLYERLVRAPKSGDRPIGQGLRGARTVTVQLDCAETLNALAGIGFDIAPRQRRICHWSAYTRPGVLRFYNHALRRPAEVPLSRLAALCSDRSAARHAEPFARLRMSALLPFQQTAP